MPFGRALHLALSSPDDSALHYAGLAFGTNLRADLFHRGKWQGYRDLGSGLVTNIGAMSIANDALTLASPSGARINTLFLANQHISGKGTTGASVLNYKIETISTNGGETAAAGAQTFSASSTMAVPIYKTIATITYTGTEAVTEWGLFTSATMSATTGSPFSGTTTATTFDNTGAAFTASSATVQGQQKKLVCDLQTTAVMGLIKSNTNTVATLENNGTTGWFTNAAQTAGSTPGNTETYVLRPIMWDRKVFSAINVVNLDSIQFTYSLTITSGG
jgi:hypothetical protein